MKYNNVYTADEENSHRFYQLPKELFLNDKYKTLSSDAKLLYTLLLDRKELSRTNGWVDEDRQVYLLYSRDKVAELLGVSRPTVTKSFKQLSACDLIIEERQGLNKPNKIYVGRIEYSDINGRKNSLHQEDNILSPNDTDLSKTEKIKRYSVTHNGGRVLNYYNKKYKQHFDRGHPTVTADQLIEIESKVTQFQNELGIKEGEFEEIIDNHFDTLSPNNDGKVFTLLTGDITTGPIRRYAE